MAKEKYDPRVTVRLNENILNLAKNNKLNLRQLLELAILQEVKNAKCPTCNRRFTRTK